MTTRQALAALGTTACLGLLLSGAAHPLIPLLCILGIFFEALVIRPAGWRVHTGVVALLHTALILPFLYFALLREPPLDFLTLLLAFAAPLLLLRSLAPRSDFNDFLIFLVSLLLVVGSAAVASGWAPLVITALFVFVACQALAVLTRRPSADGSGVRLRRVGWRPGAWAFAPGAAAYHLALLGLLLGGLLYLVLPRPNTDMDLEPPAREAHAAGRRSRRTAAGRTSARTGFPKDVRIGDIGRIKRRPYLALSVKLRARGRLYDPGTEEQTMLLLRARAWETYSPRLRAWKRPRTTRQPLGPRGVIEPGPAAPLDWSFLNLGYDGKTLFLPQRARKVRCPDALYRDEVGVITTGSGASHYGVEGAWPILPTELSGLRPDWRRRDLLAVPLAIREDLARHLPVRPGDTLASTVAAIHRFFAIGFTYTLQLPADFEPGKDPLVAFLERKEGHCELYASAGCLFLRLAGIPARLAGGLRCAERVGRGRYQARFSNAHAWVEIPCQEFGFVAIDFTPSDELAVGGSAAGGDEAAEGGAGLVAGDAGGMDWREPFRYGAEEQDRVLEWMGEQLGSWPVLGTVGFSILLLVGWGVWVGVRRGRSSPLRVSAPPGVSRKTLAFYVRWLRECAARGHVRRHFQTPREFLAALPAELREPGREITAEFEQRRWGRGPGATLSG